MEDKPEIVYTYNDFVYQEYTNQTFEPFQPTADTHKSLYLGFTLPALRQVFPNRPLSLYWRLLEVIYGTTPDNPNASVSPRLVWEYFNSQNWTKLLVNDETEALTRSGLVELLPPADISQKQEFALSPRYWLRVVWESGDYAFEPKLQRSLLNTTIATQSVTIVNEILGSSDGQENQVFGTTRSPILLGQKLQVREPEMPATKERETIETEEGENAITVTREDFENLTLASDSQIARVRCVPRRNVDSENPLKPEEKPGHVSVVIVPNAPPETLKPLPTPELIQKVTQYLEPRRLLTTRVHVVSPRYVEVGVRITLHLNRDVREADISPKAIATLQKFLHPLTGGTDSKGAWSKCFLFERTDSL